MKVADILKVIRILIRFLFRIPELAQVLCKCEGKSVTCAYYAASLQTCDYFCIMSRKYKIRDQSQLYFVTFTVIQWLDVFVRREYRDIFLESLRYCQKNKGLEVCAYCVMSSHIHLIIGRNGDQNLENIIRDIKKYTANKIIDAIRSNNQESRRELFLWLFERAGRSNSNNTNYQFWQQHNKPIELSTNEILEQRLNYIHNNPVEAGIVSAPEHYLYSSAVNYAGISEKLLEVILI